MVEKIYQTCVVGLFILSAYGWGRLTRPILDRRVLLFHSLTAIIGLAWLGLIGGVLNLTHLARPPVLIFLMVVGLGVALREILRHKPWRHRTFPLESIPLWLAPAMALGAALLLMPAGTFNINDDFHTYVTRATRMAQTGSLTGNAFDSLGVDSLGSPSFFHGFFLAIGEVGMLNGFDAVACFALCLFFVAELSLRWRMPWWLGVSALAALCWINPQYVNISPLYAGAAGIMALIVCGMFLRQALAQPGARLPGRLLVTIGLLAAWLISMKVTLAFFTAFFLTALFGLALLQAGNRLKTFRAGAATAGLVAIAVLPWCLVALSPLWHARNTAKDFTAPTALMEKYPSLAAHESVHWLEPVPLFYGSMPVFYFMASFVVFSATLAALWYGWSRGFQRKLSGLPALAAGGFAVLATMLLHSHLFPISMAVRYSCPIVIGGLFVIALGLVRARTTPGAGSRAWLGGGFATGCALVVFLFHDSFQKRLTTALNEGTLIAFDFNRATTDYSRQMLTSEAAWYHRRLQTNIPSGATALVWTAAPFQFDFQRNRLLTLSVPGVSGPALRFPAGVPVGSLENYFRSNGIQFVILETNGFGTVRLNTLARMQQSPWTVYQKLGDYGTYLRLSLDEMAARGTVRYSDGHIVVFELNRSAPPTPQRNSVALREPTPL